MTDHKQNPAEIFLIEVFDGEDYSHIWCDTPAPGESMKEEDATRYVRADLAPAGNDVLAQCISKLTLERNAQEAKRWAIQRAAEALLSAATDAEREEAQRKLHAVVKNEYDYDEVETPRPNYFDYRELQRQHDELQTMLFKERKKSSELTAQVENILKGDLTSEQFHRLSNSGFAAEIKAQAVEEFAAMLRNEAKLFEVQAECRSKGSSWYNWQTHYAGNAEKFAKAIRQSAKAGD